MNEQVLLFRAQTKLASAQAELAQFQVEELKKKREAEEEVLFDGIIDFEPWIRTKSLHQNFSKIIYFGMSCIQ